MTPLRNTLRARHPVTLMLLCSLASPLLAKESCLGGME